MTVQDWSALATSGCALLTAIFVGWQVKKMAESIAIARDQNQHLLCLEVWREYSSTFADRQQLLQSPLRLADLQRLYATIADVVSSDEYKRLKRVAGVYVLAGSLIAAGAIRQEVIYRYISVPRELWDEHLPLVRYLRAEYYPDLWRSWEQLVAATDNRWSKKARYFR